LNCLFILPEKKNNIKNPSFEGFYIYETLKAF